MGGSASGIDPMNKMKANTYKQSKDLRDQGMRRSGPEHTTLYAQMLYPEMMKLAEFDRRRSADAAAMGERRQLDALGSNMAGRNLTGSGADYYLQQGIRGGRQAGLNEANNRAEQFATGQSIDSAKYNQSLMLQALLGVPIAPKPGPAWMNPLGADQMQFSTGGTG
jgi:hypothetical protein